MTNMLEAMHSRPDGSDGRKRATIWVLEKDFTIGEYTGWECEKDYWWCPQYGYSVSVGPKGNAFLSYDAAKAAQVSRIAAEVRRLELLALRGKVD